MQLFDKKGRRSFLNLTAKNVSSGNDADKPTSPKEGDVFVATDTEKIYVCYTAAAWAGVGGASVPEQTKLPDPEVADFATPSGAVGSSGESENILNQTVSSATWNLTTSGSVRRAQKITLTGKPLNYVRWYLKKQDFPTGPMYARVRRVSDDGIIETSSTSLDASALTGSYEWYEFALSCAPNEAVRITIEWVNEDWPKAILVSAAATDLCDGIGSRYAYPDGPWTDIPEQDATIILFGGSEATASIDDNIATFWMPDPPNEEGAWLRLDMGSLKLLGGCRIYWGSEAAYRPTEYKIYTSPDGITFTEVIHETEAAPASAWKEYQWYVKYAQYIKLIVTTHGSSGTKVYEVDEYSKATENVLATHGHGGL